jgi:hypothetical protein
MHQLEEKVNGLDQEHQKIKKLHQEKKNQEEKKRYEPGLWINNTMCEIVDFLTHYVGNWAS